MLDNYVIKGGKGGEEKPHTPVETPNNLLSIAYAKVLIAVAEGELAGVPTAQDIYLDGTPLANGDGSLNFGGVTWEWRSGRQDQEYLAGLPEVATEYSVGIELQSITPWVRQITKTQLDAVRVTFQWPALLKQEQNGDTVGLSIDYAIDVSVDGGGFTTYDTYNITGKTSTTYERTHRIDLPKATSFWSIRARKITPDDTSTAVQDTMNIKSVAEVVDVKQRYPNTALLFVQFDSRLFGGGSIPRISVRTHGRIIQVPTNYHPEERVYDGIWDGSFKWAWSDNPAWVFYDMVIQDRFGLGHKVDASMIDKWALYEVAQYCDVLVDDGTNTNTKEPRHTCNVYIQEKAGAWQVLRDIASIFNGMTYWNGNQFVAIADKEENIDNIPVFSRSNVVNGRFEYQAADDKSIYTSALVSYDDPENHFNTEVEATFETSQILRWGGDRQAEISAIGCTSRGEAQRKGKYTLITNMYNRTVNFQTGLQGLSDDVLPGSVIHVVDPLIGGKPFTGRIKIAVGRIITLDRDIEASNGDILYLTKGNGLTEGRTISSVSGRVVTLNTAYTEAPQPNAIWYLESAELKSQLFRVTKISSPSEGIYEIEGVEYNESKFGAIDNGARLEPRPISVVPAGVQQPPSNILITSTTYTEQTLAVTTMTITWDQTQGATQYEGQWRVGDGDWVNLGVTGALEFNVKGIYTGNYVARIRAINASGIKSIWANSVSTALVGKVGTPPRVASLIATSMLFGIRLDWQFPEGAEDTLRTEFWYSPTTNFAQGSKLGDFAYPQDYHELHGLLAGQKFYFWCRLVDRSGNIGPWYPYENEVGVVGQSAINDNGQYNDYFAGLISQTALDAQLYSKIELIDINKNNIDSIKEELEGISDVAAIANDAIRDLEDTVDNLQLVVDMGVVEVDAKISNTNTKLNTAIADTNNNINTAVAGMNSNLDGKIASVNGRIDELTIELDDAVSGITEGLDVKIVAVNSRVDQTNITLDTAITDLNAKINNVENALAYDPYKSYLIGDVVRYGNKLYQATGAVPQNTPPPNLNYWNDIGQMIEDANALAAQVSVNTAKITEVDGKIAATASTFDVLKAGYRDINGDGDLDGALKSWDNEAKIATENLVRASEDKSLAQSLTLITANVDDNTAQISTLDRVVADNTKATAEQISRLSSNVSNSSAQILNLQSTVATSNTSVTTRLNNQQSVIEDNSAKISTLSETVAGNNTATAQSIDNIQVSVQGNSSQITSLQETVANLEGSTATKVEVLTANFREFDGEGELQGALKIYDSQAQIATENLVRASNDEALSQVVSSITARVVDNEGKINTLEKVVVDGDKVIAERLDKISANVGNNNSSISSMQVTIATDKIASAESINNLTSIVGDNAARVSTLDKAVADATTATAERFEAITSAVGGNSAQISSLAETVATLDGSMSTRVDILQATYRDDTGEGSLNDALKGYDSEAKIAQEVIVRASENRALSQSISTMTARVDDNVAQIVEIQRVSADNTKATAEQITRLTSNIDNNSSSIISLSQTVATLDSATAQRIDSLAAVTGDNAAKINTLSGVVTDANTATAQTVENLSTLVGKNEASITILAEAVSSLDASSAIRIDSLQAVFREFDGEGELNDALKGYDSEAKISSEVLTRASETKALSQSISQMVSRVDDNEAKISNLERTTAEGDVATAEKLLSLSANVSGNTSTIDSLYKVVATNEDTTAERFEQLTSVFNMGSQETSAKISSISTTFADANTATSQRVDSVEVTTGNNSGRITVVENAQSSLEDSFARVSSVVSAYSRLDGEEGELQSALNGYNSDAKFADEVLVRASADQTTAQRIQNLEATFSDALSDVNAKITEEQLVRANADGSLAQALTYIDAKFTNETSVINAGISEEKVARVTATEAIAQEITRVEASVNDNRSFIVSETQARVDAVSAVAQRVDTVAAEIVPSDTIDARITAAVKIETDARVDANYATAKQVEDVQATIVSETDINTKISSAVQVETKARVAFDGKVSSAWTVKMEINSQGQYVAAGIGLGIENTGAGLQSQFLVRADRFAVVNGIDTTTSAPFVVQGGQVFISQALIGTAWISKANISDAAIDSAKIEDLAVTSAKIQDASVDTLKIRGNSVTVPSFVMASTEATSLDWETVLDLYVTLDVTGWLYASSTGYIGYGGGFGVTDSRLVIAGNEVSFGGGDASWVNAAHSGGAFVVAGTHRIELQFRSPSGAGRIYTRSLFAMGVKR